MNAITQESLRIHLFGLPEKDRSVLERVITFASSQGKPFELCAELDHANVVVAADSNRPSVEIPVRIGVGDDCTQGCDLLLQPPLLVSRVMRVLEEARRLLAEQQMPPVGEVWTPPELSEESEEPEVVPVERVEPESVVASVPVALPPQAAPPASLSLDASRMDFEFTALVVDDSAAIRKQLELELRDAEIGVEFAESGEMALEMTAGKYYDLIFLDIVMPGIDGYEVCQRLRKRKEMKRTPIIMLSGKTSPLDEVQGIIAGASTYVTKPIQRDQFQQTLKRICKWLMGAYV
ncbi:MAG: response regulator [Chromatiales bacterium]|nr:response regulator [Chromatiales bacterium]